MYGMLTVSINREIINLQPICTQNLCHFSDFHLGSHAELMYRLVGMVRLKMVGLDLTLHLTRAWLEALHLMNSYIETRAPEELAT